MMASGFFLLYLAISRGQIRLGFKDILRIAWVGLLLSIHWLLFYGSIKYSNVSIGVVCFASVGFFTAIIDPFWSKRAFSIREVAFSLLTILGIALIFHFDTRYQVGIILGILSAIAASVLTIETRRVGSDYPPMTFLFYEVLSSFVIMSAILPIYLAIFPVETIAPSVSDLIYLLLGLCLAATLLAAIFQFGAALKDDPKKTLGSLVGIVLFFVVLIVTWAMASDEPLALAGYSPEELAVMNDPFWLKVTDMFIYAIYFLFGTSIILMMLSFVKKMMKK